MLKDWPVVAEVKAKVNAQVHMQKPRESLRPFVKRFVVVEFPSERKLKLLPDTGFVAEFRFRGEQALEGGTNLPRTVISGLWNTTRTRIYDGGSAILMASFTGMGAAAFLRDPLDRLFNTTIAVDNVMSRAPELGRLEERLASAENHMGRI